jgi:hypothetical protein
LSGTKPEQQQHKDNIVDTFVLEEEQIIDKEETAGL